MKGRLKRAGILMKKCHPVNSVGGFKEIELPGCLIKYKKVYLKDYYCCLLLRESRLCMTELTY